jgi:DNA repair protein RadC
MPLKDLPAEARPREKLLAILLRTGIRAKRAEIVAVLELARRAMAQKLQERTVFDAPDTVRHYVQLHPGTRAHEVFAVLSLDNQNRLIAMEEMFPGTLRQTRVTL